MSGFSLFCHSGAARSAGPRIQGHGKGPSYGPGFRIASLRSASGMTEPLP